MKSLPLPARLFGQALAETPRSGALLLRFFLAAVVVQVLLVGAHILVPELALRYEALRPHLATFDLATSGSLASGFSSFLFVLGAFACLALALIDTRAPRAALAWWWGAAAFLVLAVEQSSGVGAALSDMLLRGIAGAPRPAELLPLAYAILFGGFFGVALWRMRFSPLALAGYGLFALSFVELAPLLERAGVAGTRAEEYGVPFALRMLGTSLVVVALAANLLRTARRAAPLAIQRRRRLAV